MGYSTNTYEYTGGAQQFPVSFSLGFIERTDVTVYVEGNLDGLGAQVYSAFTWISDSLIEVSDSLTSGDMVVIERTVDKSVLNVNFNNEGTATRGNLQNALTQVMMALHEFIDGRVTDLEDIYPFSFYIATMQELYADSVVLDANIEQNRVDSEAAQTAAETAQTGAETAQTAAETAQTAAETARTGAETAETNLETARDAALAAQADAETAQASAETAQAASEAAQTGAETARTGAETAETGAVTARTAAETAQTGAETAQAASEAARDKAQLWSEETTDVEVEPGEYSAKHWADKAQLYSGGAVVAGAIGAVQLSDGAGQLTADEDNLVWDASNIRLGIGTNAPGYPLDVQTDNNYPAYFGRAGSSNGYIRVGSKLHLGSWGDVCRLGTSTTGDVVLWTGANFQLLATHYNNGGITITDATLGSAGRPTNDAILNVQGTTGGLLFPRLTTAQRTAISTPSEGLVLFDTDLGTLMVYQGGEWSPLSINSSAPDVVVQDQKASGVGGGAVNTGYYNTWKKRTLNTEVRDVLGVTLSADAVTLPVGKYYIEARTPGFGANHFRCRIYDETHSVEISLGSTGFSGTNAQDWAFADGYFEATEATAVSVQYIANFNGASSNNLGTPGSFASTLEVYTTMNIWKVG